MVMTNEHTTFLGRIRSISGQVATVQCESEVRPRVHDVVVTDDEEPAILEAYHYISPHELKCLILKNGDLHRNKKVFSTGAPLRLPVGTELLGRAINMFGEPEDGAGPINAREFRPVMNVPDTRFASFNTDPVLLETGIKAIDFFAPVVRGAKVGLIGGAGVGKTVLMNELLNNLTKTNKGVTIFSGIGERVHEAHELWLLLNEYKLLKRTIMILGMINQNAGIRFRTASSTAALVEYYRDEQKEDVLLFVDNIFRFLQAGSELSSLLEEIPSEFGYQPSLQSEIASFENRLSASKDNAVTAVQTMYVPEDRLSDPAVTTTLPHLNSVIVLSRDVAQEGRRPALDLLQTKSSYLTREVVGAEHYDAVTESTKVMQKYNNLKRIVSIVGEAELSEENRREYRRAEQLINYMTQPFFFTEDQTGLKGVSVNAKQVVEDVQRILSGEFDALDPYDFLMKGDLRSIT